jgi:hypothetical protein
MHLVAQANNGVMSNTMLAEISSPAKVKATVMVAVMHSVQSIIIASLCSRVISLPS